MPYIYKYIDVNDEKCKYVGISKDKTTFNRRLKSHKTQDKWYTLGVWRIERAFVESECDAQFLEGWLISEYGTGRWYNEQKVNWGKSCLFELPELDWEVIVLDTKKQNEDVFYHFIQVVLSVLKMSNGNCEMLHELIDMAEKIEGI